MKVYQDDYAAWWFNGPACYRQGRSQAHKRKLRRQYEALHPRTPVDEAALIAEMERVWAECTKGPQPDWIYITDEALAEVLGLRVGMNHV